MNRFKKVEPLVKNGITLAEINTDLTKLWIINVLSQDETFALHDWLTRALYGEGFVLVPREPTEEMYEIAREMCDEDEFYRVMNIYRAMLAAAPKDGGKQ